MAPCLVCPRKVAGNSCIGEHSAPYRLSLRFKGLAGCTVFRRPRAGGQPAGTGPRLSCCLALHYTIARALRASI